MPQPPPPTSPAAVVALVFGVLAWTAMPFAGALVAVIAAHIARRDIRNSAGTLGGDQMASAGALLGWIQLGLVLALLIALACFIVIGTFTRAAH